MSEIFKIEPKSHALAKRREVTLTVSLVAHVIGFAFVAFVVLRPAKVVTEPKTIPAFVMDAPVVQKAAAAPARAAAPEPKPTPQPEPTPTPVTPPTTVSNEPPPPVASSVNVGQSTGDVTQMTGAVGAVSGNALGAPPAAEPVHVGGNIKAPALVQKTPPDYPRAAKDARVQGAVILEAQVGPDGRVQSVKVLRSVAMLDDAAVNAVKTWRYKPLTLNGAAVPFILTVTVTFDLG